MVPFNEIMFSLAVLPEQLEELPNRNVACAWNV